MTAAAVVRGRRRRTGWSPRGPFIHLGIFVRDKLRWFLLGHVQRVVRRRQETLILGHGQQALLLRLTRVVLVLDGLMLRRNPAVILPVAISHGYAGRRCGRHSRALPGPAGQRSRITAATAAAAADSRLAAAANHAGVMLLGMLLLMRRRRSRLLHTVILRMMVRIAVAAAAAGSHRRK